MYKESISTFFKNVENKSKINMSLRFSQLHIPQIDMNESDKKNQLLDIEEKKDIEIEDEVDLLNF